MDVSELLVAPEWGGDGVLAADERVAIERACFDVLDELHARLSSIGLAANIELQLEVGRVA